jgi:hypothetical protein
MLTLNADAEQAYMEEGKAGFKMCRFELKVHYSTTDLYRSLIY